MTGQVDHGNSGKLVVRESKLNFKPFFLLKRKLNLFSYQIGSLLDADRPLLGDHPQESAARVGLDGDATAAEQRGRPDLAGDAHLRARGRGIPLDVEGLEPEGRDGRRLEDELEPRLALSPGNQQHFPGYGHNLNEATF